MIYNNRAGDGVTITSPAFNASKETMTMDKEMMRALQQDAAILEAMGAGEQPLAFFDGQSQRICDSCLTELADFDSNTCVGCDAYKDHQ
jgi:hypothetical protein